MHITLMMCSLVVLADYFNYFIDYNTYKTNKIISRPKTSFDEGEGAVGEEKHLFLGKTADVANWQINLLFCFRA